MNHEGRIIQILSAGEVAVVDFTKVAIGPVEDAKIKNKMIEVKKVVKREDSDFEKDK